MKFFKKTRFILFMCIIVALFLAYYLDIAQYLNIDFFKQQKSVLLDLVHDHYVFAVFLFTFTYMITIALSLPSAATLSLLGGFLFNVIPGILYILIGAISGAILAFLSARYLIGSWFQHRYKEILTTFNTEFDQWGIYYLISLRLIPVVPFFIANILAGLTNIKLKTFVWTTALGIIPATFIFCFAGQQLQTIESVRDVLSTSVLSALFLLGLLALLPIITKKMYIKKQKKS